MMVSELILTVLEIFADMNILLIKLQIMVPIRHFH